jgi:glycosyltransferase involved in cell wall biosynthesis
MAKILWHADGGCHTGFARVTHSIGERLVRDYGHEIHVLAINHRGDDFPSLLDPKQKTPLWLYRPETILVNDLYGKSRVLELLAKVEPDVVVEYNDPHILLNLFYKNQYDPPNYLVQWRPILAYVPCDGTNLPPEWQRLTSVTNVVAMSKYGQSQYPGSKLVYHGIDTDQFWPISEKPIVTSTGIECRSKKDCKQVFGFERDGFLVLRVDKNSGRKDFGATFSALVPFMKRHGDVQVHLHTQANESSSGVNLNALITREPGVDPERWFFPGLADSWIGWTQQDLNALYNAADVFISTSRGEGFGLTLAESLACGVPVIAQNVSAIPEVVGPGGVLIEPQRLITVPSGEDVWLADIAAFTEALEHLYESAGARRSLGEAGVEHVRANFDWEVATEKFDRYITALASAGQEQPDAVRVEPGVAEAGP